MATGTVQRAETALVERPEPSQTMIEVASSRAAQEVQAAMVVAKRFPRDTVAAERRILDACRRARLAENALYSYPRGGTRVEGESIRLAEVYAQNWGNVESGVVELSRVNGESVAMAYCMDLETNSRDVKVFTVKHIRDRNERKGGAVELTEERDIYELVANMGARRKRACILSIIPIDIREAAVTQCRKTLEGDTSVPLIDRVKSMVQAFEGLGVTATMIQQRLGHILSATTPQELVSLRGIFTSLKDGMSKVDDWFGPAPTEDPNTGGVQGLKERMKAQRAPAEAPTRPVAEEPAPEGTPEPPAEETQPVEAAGEPGVYACTECHKTFNAYARGKKCPHCGAGNEKIVATADLPPWDGPTE